MKNSDVAAERTPPKATAALARANKLLAQLADVELGKLLSHLELVNYSYDECIYDVGARIAYVVFPLDAVVSSLALMEDGALIEVSMVGREGLVGLTSLLSHSTSRHWTRICSPGQALKLEVRYFNELFLESIAAQRAVLSAYQSFTIQVSQRSVCNAMHSLIERLSCWLLMFQDRVRSDDLLLTQESIAMRLGSRRAGISGAAGSLREMKAISYHRGTVQISDRSVLEHIACECYRVLKEDFERPASRLDVVNRPRRRR